MAAITIKLENQADVTELDSAAGAITPEEADEAEDLIAENLNQNTFGNLVGATKEYSSLTLTELTAENLNKSHAELVNMAYVRRAVSESLVGAKICVETSSIGEVSLKLDRPVGNSPAWNPPASPGVQKFSLLSWTSKMGCPSFSLPAGAQHIGGTCPGAAAAQSIVPLELLKKNAKHVEAVIGVPVRLSQATCGRCYAEGGQYATGQVQFAQAIRQAWVNHALRDGSFVEVMTFAIEHADFELADEPDGQQYFRIHDSGDFYSKEYLKGWRAITDALPHILFWAPSRVWAVPALREAVNQINRGSKNLVIRPSSYHINENPPRDLGPGWSQGTVVFHEKQKDAAWFAEAAHWDCPAYAVDDQAKTCRNAIAPSGDPGCRVCWCHPHTDEVNYTLH